jgi:hypothetical protein
VYPAKHIADLKSDVNDRSDNLDKNKDQ